MSKRGSYRTPTQQMLSLYWGFKQYVQWAITNGAPATGPAEALKAFEEYAHTRGMRLLPPDLIERWFNGDQAALCEPEHPHEKAAHYYTLSCSTKDPVLKKRYLALAKQAAEEDVPPRELI